MGMGIRLNDGGGGWWLMLCSNHVFFDCFELITRTLDVIVSGFHISLSFIFISEYSAVATHLSTHIAGWLLYPPPLTLRF